MTYFYTEYDYLAHHGVKGMKWGVRRYRNDDGSLTAAGKKRYQKDLNKYNKYLEKQANSKSRLLKRVYGNLADRHGGRETREAYIEDFYERKYDKAMKKANRIASKMASETDPKKIAKYQKKLARYGEKFANQKKMMTRSINTIADEIDKKGIDNVKRWLDDAAINDAFVYMENTHTTTKGGPPGTIIKTTHTTRTGWVDRDTLNRNRTRNAALLYSGNLTRNNRG